MLTHIGQECGSPSAIDFLFFFVEQIGVNAQQCEQIFAGGKIQLSGISVTLLPCFFLNFVTLEVNLFSSIEVLTCFRM